MITASVDRDPFDRTLAALDRAARIDLYPLAVRLKGIMVDGNRAGLLAGTDADGNRTADLAESTLADPRRPGDGPARVPRHEGSRMIAGFRGEIDVTGPFSLSVVGHWPEVPFVKYHTGKDRRNGRPARDPVGLRPGDRAILSAAVRDFASLIVSGRS